MPFPWYHSQLPQFIKDTFKSKGEAQVRDRIKTQTRILRNMGYSLDETIERVRLYLKWEWEIPREREIPCWDEVNQLVEETFKNVLKEYELGFADPTKVHDEIRSTYMKGKLDAGNC